MGPIDSNGLNDGPAGESRQQKQPDRRLAKIKKIIRKFWYVLVILAVIIIAAITLQLLVVNKAAAWDTAAEHFSKAEYKEAEEIIRDFSIPDNPEHQLVYAQTMMATGNIDKALPGYQELYESNNDASTKMIIGNIYNQKEEYDKAIDIYREIIGNNPANAQAYINLSTVYRLQGKNDEALKITNDAVNNNPQSGTLLELRISMLMEDKETTEYQEAVEALKRVRPDSPLIEALEQQ